ncbi:4'-phosphopantetheinyl transferase [Halteromyces radiatus]|uniref:4'-phosphopantetheinyl transferase n=1 Tax=Halteromyces radiatus TaxID=101107 RepID=UPI002220AF37|nr:4'-phosphopantetheinyl transferase [Halteromyces radiatus]KAI8081566.1 4'-phosphopantetheinyl transferase [Halteromyces radiatus]
MILGIGVDIIHLPRIVKVVKHSRERFARRILSPTEYQEFFQRFPKPTDAIQQQQEILYLGSRWCIKEAVYKALYPIHKLEWKQVTVTKEKGKPGLHIINGSKHGIHRSHVSLSHDGEYAIAQVILESKD